MKRVIVSAEQNDLSYEDLQKIIFGMKRRKQINYDKISKLTKGVRLAYQDDDVRMRDFEYLQNANISGIADITLDDATDEIYPLKTPYYIRLIFDNVERKGKNVDPQDFKNVDPRDIDILSALASKGVIPTVSTSSALRKNSNYDDSDKYIELIDQDDQSRTYDVPYDRYDIRGDRIYSTPITIYDDGYVSIDDNEPLLLDKNLAKLTRQFKMSHWK